MTLKIDAKFEEKLFVLSKLIRIWLILICSFRKKYVMFDLKKYRVMQNLKKNWLTDWKIAWGIWQIFTRALESWDLKLGLLWVTFIPSRKCMRLKFTGELCVMTMKKDAKFEKELTSSKLTWGI